MVYFDLIDEVFFLGTKVVLFWSIFSKSGSGTIMAHWSSSPYNRINHPICAQYLMLFNTLWRAKRMEWVLSGVWQRLASLHKMTRQLKELGPVLHFANLVASEMIHFVHQLSYYITFEVRPTLQANSASLPYIRLANSPL
jgi:hypothetical protein